MMYGREKLEEFHGYYDKYEADKVMDAMERRIARLTALVEGWKRNSVVLGDMYKERLAIEQARIKELEATISKMETTTPMWISVKDRLPEGNLILPALTEDGIKIWWGAWHDVNLEIYGITHWLDNALPPPPTTEEK